jgi:hypothetical protein
MLPKITELEFEEVLEQEQGQPIRLRSFLFDFDTGDFVLKDGKLIEIVGIEVIKQWIEMTVRTERNKFKVYEGTDYGIQLEDLIGSSYPHDFIEAEMKRELTESLIAHPAIQSISNFSLIREGEIGKVSFYVETTEGAFDQEVNIIG